MSLFSPPGLRLSAPPGGFGGHRNTKTFHIRIVTARTLEESKSHAEPLKADLSALRWTFPSSSLNR